MKVNFRLITKYMGQPKSEKAYCFISFQERKRAEKKHFLIKVMIYVNYDPYDYPLGSDSFLHTLLDPDP